MQKSLESIVCQNILENFDFFMTTALIAYEVTSELFIMDLLPTLVQLYAVGFRALQPYLGFKSLITHHIDTLKTQRTI